jgi:DGQHR domain-containing protein
LPPFEIIDGQHRLWAFDEPGAPQDYQLPVVAFHSLDISWQAYLFYVINIKPKRINRSLAYDLYPLLRTEEWLERFEGAGVYRETRAQELTELLWSHPQSPWRGRINMLGDPGVEGVSQAAWVRSLVVSFVRSWEGSDKRIGGLFGAPVGSDRLALLWSRAQQAAFLIEAWNAVAEAVDRVDADWTAAFKSTAARRMFAQHSLINTDQGVRAILHVLNDCTYVQAADLALFNWVGTPVTTEAIDLREVTAELKEAATQPFAAFVRALATAIATFDWRSSSTPGLPEAERLSKAAFRGSGGYGELRKQLTRHVAASKANQHVAGAAARVAELAKMS